MGNLSTKSMICIFCKNEASSSKSVEHIIPESLGNIEHTLPPGTICDKCNNYFSIKVEKPLLESIKFKQIRHYQEIPSKRGNIPTLSGVILPVRIEVEIGHDLDGNTYILSSKESQSVKLADFMKNGASGKLIIPKVENIDKKLMSRFLAKVALEILVYKSMSYCEWRSEIVDNAGLDALRNYARFNIGSKIWEFSHRRIYNANSFFDGNYQVLHEFDLLMTNDNELFAIICIFGEEYTISLCRPEIEGYEAWLIENQYLSPLYSDKNK